MSTMRLGAFVRSFARPGSPNIGRYERGVRFVLGALFLFAAVALFKDPFARIAAAVAGAFLFWECAAGFCPLHAHLGARSPADALPSAVRHFIILLGVQLVMAYEWWSAGWEKVSDPSFLPGMPKTLGFFASKNPFGWYRELLLGPGLKNAQAFGVLVEWGQVLIAIGLALSAVLFVYSRREEQWRLALLMAAVALAGGMFMNANFYLAAGWTGPGTKGSNVVMFWAQALLLYAWLQELSRPRSERARTAAGAAPSR